VDGVPGKADDFEIGDADPNDLTLVWRGRRADYAVTGDWEFTISGDDTLKPKVIEGIIDDNFAQAVIGATSIDFRIGAGYYGKPLPFDPEADGVVEILLGDGTTITPKFSSWATRDGEHTQIGYMMPFINPDGVVSVRFNGVAFGGSLGSPANDEPVANN
jgi:hypothetical protein